MVQKGNGNYLRIVKEGKDHYLEIRQKLGPGVPSASGKTRVVFSTNGNQVIEDGQIDGKAVTVGINAYFRP